MARCLCVSAPTVRKEAGRSSRGEPVIMSLARGGKSQYSKNKNGFETWGGPGTMYSRAEHKWDVGLAVSPCLHVLSAARGGGAHNARLMRDAFISLLALIFIDMRVSSDLKCQGLKCTNGTCRSLIRTINNG